MTVRMEGRNGSVYLLEDGEAAARPRLCRKFLRSQVALSCCLFVVGLAAATALILPLTLSREGGGKSDSKNGGGGCGPYTIEESIRGEQTAADWPRREGLPNCLGDPALMEQATANIDASGMAPIRDFREIKVPFRVVKRVWEDIACWPSWMGYFKQLNRTRRQLGLCKTLDAAFHNPNMVHGDWNVEDHLLKLEINENKTHYSWMYVCGPWGANPGTRGIDMCVGRHDHITWDSGKGTTIFYSWERGSGVIIEKLNNTEVTEKCGSRESNCTNLALENLNPYFTMTKEHALSFANRWAMDGAKWCLEPVFMKYGDINCTLIQQYARDNPSSMCMLLDLYDPTYDYINSDACPNQGCPRTVDSSPVQNPRDPRAKFAALLDTDPGYMA